MIDRCTNHLFDSAADRGGGNIVPQGMATKFASVTLNDKNT